MRKDDVIRLWTVTQLSGHRPFLKSYKLQKGTEADSREEQ